MSNAKELKYTKEHEWINLQGDTATVGITHFAQAELGDLVFVDLPDAGKEVKQGDTLCVVESTKAASDVYAPIDGRVTEVNEALKNNPELVNQDPYARGWLVKLDSVDKDKISELMNEDEYKKHIGE